MSDKHPTVKKAPDVPTSAEFSQTLGQVTFLMSVSKSHRTLTVADIESRVMAPLMFRQVRVFLKGKQPIAVLIWAYTSEEVSGRVSAGDLKLGLQDWRSGPEVTVVECISPFGDGQIFIDEFQKEVATAKARQPSDTITGA